MGRSVRYEGVGGVVGCWGFIDKWDTRLNIRIFASIKGRKLLRNLLLRILDDRFFKALFQLLPSI